MQTRPQATVTVHPDSETTAYSPMLFGGFLEHFGRQIYGGVLDPGSPLSDDMGFRTDVLDALKELKVPVIRWPGGCYASGYHWYEGVGRERKPTDDLAWGVVEPHTFGTDEFVEYCRRLGAEPYICNNAGNGTIEEMRDWVEYCNGEEGKFATERKNNGHEKPFGVEIWSIGNENWGGHEIGNKPADEWAPLVRRAAQAMKAADPDIQLTAAAMVSREWTLPLLEQAGSYLDYISIHNYWLGLWQQNDTPDYLTCIMKSQDPEMFIVNCIDILEEAGCRGRIKIAFDEWNLRGWHHPGFPRKEVQDYDDPEVIRLVAAREKNLIASQYTMADALFSASFLNGCLRHATEVGMANIAPLVNTRGPLFVHPEGIVKRAHFHTLAMYANLLEPRVASATVEAGRLEHGDNFVPVVDAVATVDDAGETWAFALVNRDPLQEAACTISLRGNLPDGVYNATVLSGDSPDAFNDTEQPDRVAPAKVSLRISNGVAVLPPHSLTIVSIPEK